ncbi:uncharacterized protein LOC110979476 isoform X1 [Acanthaster planci]|uniref:Uncharacterized protein LOC110979476 isoform X1 n=1 Tax=Acanthaster planci TaxID=133434 RepID=A0A8B7YCL0_ACAPL|nr:uncharacterized protein LOC110979476 isoform X1 [Acanthaster planci]
MNRALILRSLLPRARASFSTTTRSQIQNKVKENQLRFQSKDGQEEAIKAGSSVDPRVRIAYNAAMTIAGVCFAFLGFALYVAAHKTDQQNEKKT